MDQKLLGIYLNDHLAGAIAGLELARRCYASNSGTPLGDFLAELVQEIDADRMELEALMDQVGVTKDRLKQGAAWASEKVGRLKLNGRLTGYSPLSRLIELEGLTLGVEGKASLWKSLKRISDLDTRLATTDFDRLIKRAEEQLDGLEQQRQEAAVLAFR
jgi:hypothetical protein